MASKSRGGLSKREYAASKAGGSLNYKTGKALRPATRKTSSDPYAGMDWESAANKYKDTHGLSRSSDLTGTAFDKQMNARFNSGGSGSYQGEGPFLPSDNTPNTDAYKNAWSERNSKKSERPSDYKYTQPTNSGSDYIAPILRGGGGTGSGGFNLPGMNKNPGLSLTGTDNNEFNDGSFLAPQLGMMQQLPGYENIQSPLTGLSDSTASTQPIESYLGGGTGNPLAVPRGSVSQDPAVAPKKNKKDSGDGGPEDDAPIVEPIAATLNEGNGGGGGVGGGAFNGLGGILGMQGLSSGSGKGGKKRGGYPGEDGYLKNARRDMEDSFRRMLEGLDPTYQGYEQDLESEIAKSQALENQNLLARQMSYGTADSEQREQAQERLASDYTGRRAQFMRQLADRKSTQQNEIGLQRSQSLADMDMKRYQAAVAAWNAQQQQAQQDFENQIALYTAQKKGSGGGSEASDSWSKIGYVTNPETGEYGIQSINKLTGESRIDPLEQGLEPWDNSQNIWDLLNQNNNG